MSKQTNIQLLTALREGKSLTINEYDQLLDAAGTYHPLVKKAIDYVVSRAVNGTVKNQNLQSVIDRLEDPGLSLEEIRQSIALTLPDPGNIKSKLEFLSELMLALEWNPQLPLINVGGRADLVQLAVLAHLAAGGSKQAADEIRRKVFKNHRRYGKAFCGLSEKHPGLAEMVEPFRPEQGDFSRRWNEIACCIVQLRPAFVIPMALLVLVTIITAIVLISQHACSEQVSDPNDAVAIPVDPLDICAERIKKQLAEKLTDPNVVIGIITTNSEWGTWLECLITQLEGHSDRQIIPYETTTRLLDTPIPDVCVSSGWLDPNDADNILHKVNLDSKRHKLFVIQVTSFNSECRLKIIDVKNMKLIYAAMLPSPAEFLEPDTLAFSTAVTYLNDGVRTGNLDKNECYRMVRILHCLSVFPIEEYLAYATEAEVVAKFSQLREQDPDTQLAMRIARLIAEKHDLDIKDDSTGGLIRATQLNPPPRLTITTNAIAKKD